MNHFGFNPWILAKADKLATLKYVTLIAVYPTFELEVVYPFESNRWMYASFFGNPQIVWSQMSHDLKEKQFNYKPKRPEGGTTNAKSILRELHFWTIDALNANW